jgi:hypothetical protein
MLKCRSSEGTYSILIKNHLESDSEELREYCRLNKKQLDFILSLIREEIEPKKINAINAKQKLFLTLSSGVSSTTDPQSGDTGVCRSTTRRRVANGGNFIEIHRN